MVRRFLWLPAAAALALAGLRCDNVSCKTVVTNISTTCLPDSIDEDREVHIELREACGRNCARMPLCTATLVAGVVVMDVHADQCNDVNAINCPPCFTRSVTCKLPPLPQGDYTLRGPGLPDELLRVRRGGAVGCTLPAGPDAGM